MTHALMRRNDSVGAEAEPGLPTLSAPALSIPRGMNSEQARTFEGCSASQGHPAALRDLQALRAAAGRGVAVRAVPGRAAARVSGWWLVMGRSRDSRWVDPAPL